MTDKRYLTIPITLVVLAALACSLPGTAPPDATATFGAALTQAFATAQTAAETAGAGTPIVEVTGLPASATPVTEAVGPPTDTPTTAPTETPGPTGCIDNAKFIADVTIPDGTQFATPSGFTKTWRVQNTGTCTWDPTYTLRFVGGSQLGGPPAVAFPGTVPAGATMDISVNLVSPAAAGSYTGRWRLTNALGAHFGINGQPLTVVIVVPATPTQTPTHTPVPPTATFTATATATPTATSGPIIIITIPPPVLPTIVTISAGGGTGGIYSPPATVFGAPNAGDDESNRSRQGFATFSLASIPAGATIISVRLDLSPFDQLGNPFSLGCLRGYQQNYGGLDPGDFFTGSALGALWRFCSAADLTDTLAQAMDASGVALIQSSLVSGQFQMRLQFNENATNGNGVADLLRPTPRLIVAYTGP